MLSLVGIFGGFILLSAAWKVLYEAQRQQTLATTGVYAYVGHPQYVGFIVIMLGFLLQWPTLLTLLMFRGHVCAARALRGAAGAGGIRRRLRTLYG
jgi:protein-S-isoprenylcysteine O-methyltransferase Ste14